MRIAVIPARSGSKRIIDKNIKNFLGKPMISYSILALKKSKMFDEIIVSTDSKPYSDLAKKYGATIIDIRPKYLSGDKVGLISVYKYLINKYELQSCESLTSLMPCSPFITADQIKSAIKKFEADKLARSLMAVCEYEAPIGWALEIESGLIKFKNKKSLLKSANELQKSYYDAGSLYIYNPKFISNKKIITEKIMPFVMSKNLVIDIDSQEDWDRAELMGKILKKLS